MTMSRMANSRRTSTTSHRVTRRNVLTGGLAGVDDQPLVPGFGVRLRACRQVHADPDRGRDGRRLNQLERIAGGENPDAEGNDLPAGVGDGLDLRKVGMFGFALGGCATANTLPFCSAATPQSSRKSTSLAETAYARKLGRDSGRSTGRL